MAFFGVQLNAQINRLINQIKLTLAKNKYLPNFRTIYKAFVKYDSQQSGVVSLVNFQKALNQNGFFFKKFQIQAFYKAFGQGGDRTNWFNFLSILRVPMNEYRSKIVNLIFDYLDSQGHGYIHYTTLKNKFNPHEILQYKLSLKSKQIIEKQLLGLVHLTQNGYVKKQQFYNFYNDLSLNIPSDKLFVEFVSSHWDYKLQEQFLPVQQQIKTAIRLIRFKLIQRTQGTNQEFLLRQVFDQFDINKNGNLNQQQLYTMLVKLQIPTESRMIKPLLKKLDRNGNGYVEFDQFKNFLFFDPYPI